MLYNEFRPKSFSDVIGQPAAMVLENLSWQDEITTRSILMSGTRGVGKTSMARILARAVNCKSQKKRPCYKCESCRQNNHPDIYEIDSTVHGNPGAIQQLQQRMYLLPEYNYKVFILDEAHTITQKGMAILLKVIEEPPPNTLIMLLTTEPEKLDRALRSRCMWLQLKNLTRMETAKVILRVTQSQGLEISREALFKISEYANGSARDALSLLEVVAPYEKINSAVVESVVGHRVDTDELVRLFLSGRIKESLDSLMSLCVYHEPRMVCESILAGLAKSVVTAVDSKLPVNTYLQWLDVFKKAKEEIVRGMYQPAISLELALVDGFYRLNLVPPPAIMLNDWDAFLYFVRTNHSKYLLQVKSLRFVRVKGSDTVVLKKIKNTEIDEDKLQKIIKHYLGISVTLRIVSGVV